MATEHFTIYDTTTGEIRRAGFGPPGIGALQPVVTGEASIPVRSLPSAQEVDLSGAHPVVVTRPGLLLP
ncbi:MAG: hypothetical protein JO295_14380 [Verrucomicrobia bacterium]|nr:hypothetical protein [Verrucomicrobiota bacterium]